MVSGTLRVPPEISGTRSVPDTLEFGSLLLRSARPRRLASTETTFDTDQRWLGLHSPTKVYHRPENYCRLSLRESSELLSPFAPRK